MNFIILLIAIILILNLLLYYGPLISITIEKNIHYQIKISILKITIFKKDNLTKKKESNKSQTKIKDNNSERDNKSLKEKYDAFKPILNEINTSKETITIFIKKFIKTLKIKKLEGNLIIGLNNHNTTIKIASFIWSIGAIVNTTSKSTLLTVTPNFTEETVKFEGRIEFRVNLLLIIILGIKLISKKTIRNLIKEIYVYKKAKTNN